MSGKKGVTKAQVHPVFTNRLDDLRDNADGIQQSLIGGATRPWQVPADFTGNLLDVPELHKPAFDRKDINVEYEQVMQTPTAPGTTGDVIGLKYQLDVNASEERAFRVRHMTPIRALCHAGGRRYGHANSRMFENIQDQAAKMIANGAAGGSDQPPAVPPGQLPADGSIPPFETIV